MTTTNNTTKTLVDQCKDVETLLREEGNVWADVYPEEHGLPVICVHIEHGDWKHEHMCTKWLMEENGYPLITSRTTYEDGSDNYSATHYFVMKQ